MPPFNKAIRHYFSDFGRSQPRRIGQRFRKAKAKPTGKAYSNRTLQKVYDINVSWLLSWHSSFVRLLTWNNPSKKAHCLAPRCSFLNARLGFLAHAAARRVSYMMLASDTFRLENAQTWLQELRESLSRYDGVFGREEYRENHEIVISIRRGAQKNEIVFPFPPLY